MEDPLEDRREAVVVLKTGHSQARQAQREGFWRMKVGHLHSHHLQQYQLQLKEEEQAKLDQHLKPS